MPESDERRWNVVLASGVTHSGRTTSDAMAMLLAQYTGDEDHDMTLFRCAERLAQPGIAEIWVAGHRIINVH